MSILDERAAKAIQEAMDARVRALSVKSATSHMAEVIEIDAEGVTWVHIFGGADRTPAIRTLAKVKKGDLVTVTIEEGVVTITGSPSSPSASIEYVDAANYEIASYAKEAIAGILGDVIQVKNAIIERATIEDLTAVEATIETLTADYANLNELVAGKASIQDLTAATARIETIESDYLTASDMTAEQARVGTLLADYAHLTNGVIDNATIDQADVNDLDANYAHITQGVIDNASISYADVDDLDANYAHITQGVIDNASISYADIEDLDAHYAEIDLANVNNAWLTNGVIKNAAITNEQVLSVSANKLTAGTIDASDITVTNLNASNITVGTLNGNRIGTGSLSLDKLSEDVYTETEVDAMVDALNDRIDSAIETYTVDTVPTLNNYPASGWTTDDLKDEHIGDVAYVVNAADSADGYCYRFAYDATAGQYKWVLIKDSDVTAALQRLVDAEGDIDGLQSFQSTTSSWMSSTDEELRSVKTRVTNAETSLGNKVETSTFNELSQTVDTNSASITSLTTKTDTALSRGIEYIVGTHGTTATSTWTGVSSDASLYTGKQIAFYMTSTGVSGTTSTLNLQLSTGSWTGAKTVRLNNTNVTNHYPAGTVIKLTYDGTYWKCDNYDSNTYDREAYKASVTASGAISSGRIGVFGTDGKLKLLAASAFDTSYPILYVGTAYTTSALTQTNNYTFWGSAFNLTNTHAITGAAAGKPVYIVGSMSGNVMTPTSDVLTCTVPTQADGLFYMRLGLMSTTSNAVLESQHPIYAFVDGSFQQATKSVVTTSNTVNTVQQTANSNSAHISNLTTVLGTNADGTTASNDIVHKYNELDQTVDGITTSIGSIQNSLENKADGSTVTSLSNQVNTISDTVDGHTQSISSINNTMSTKADSSTVSSLSSQVNTISDTVDGHTQSISSLNTTIANKADGSTVTTLSNKVNNIEETVDGHTQTLESTTFTLKTAIKSTTQLWFSKADTTAPSKPTAHVMSTSTDGNAWRTVVPAYNATYPNYFYCYEWEYTDGTYGWSAVTRDIAMGETQERARTAVTNASAAQATADKNVKESIQLWFTKANTTAPDKPTSAVTSTATTGNAWTTKVPAYSTSYPNYFYCYQWKLADGTYTWSDVVFDQATTENQKVARDAAADLSELRTDYATFKQTTTEFESTIGTTYATKTELGTTNSNVTTAQTDATNALNRKVAYSATSATAAATAAKVATCAQFPALAAGVTVTVRFSVANTSTGAITLNVNSTGAKTIYVNGAATASGNQMLWAANANVTFTYDGTYWRVVSEPRTWYGTCATAAGTAEKAATINEIVVCKGTVVKLNMTYENTSTSAAMNLTSTGAKALFYGTTTTRPTTANGYGWGAASTATFVFDGGYWRVGDTSVLSRLIQAESTISSHTTSINQNAEAIALKASQSDVDSLSGRVATAEGSITTQAGQIALKANAADVYSKTAADALLEVKANKDTLTSEINASADTVKISADRVNIEGAAIFSSGRLSESTLNSTYDAKGSASAAQSAAISAAASDATSKANAAQAAAISAAATDATNKANAANAQEQLIYCSKASGTTSLSATTTWVTATGDTQNAWTLRRPTYSQSYPVLFVATQRKTVGGTVTCTTPQIDNTTTVIDGGNIITGSVTANKLNAADINASNTLTVGAFTSAAQSDILNSNVQVGGRNYILNSAGTLVSGLGAASGSSKEYQALNVGQSYMDVPDQTQVTISFDLYMTVNTANPTLQVYNTNNDGPKHFRGTAGSGEAAGTTLSFTAAVNTVISKRVSVTGYIVDRTNPPKTDNYLEFYSNYGSSNWFSISNLKLEVGNVATDWTPAPEDLASASDSVEYIVGTQTAATGSWTGVTRDSTLYTGKTIAYKLPYAGSGNASLQLKDASGNNVGGNIAVYSMTTRVTTHYPAGSVIQMSFDGSYWRTAGWYNTNNFDRRLHNNYVKAASAVASGAMACGTSAGYKQIAASVAFDLSYPILWAGGAWTSGTQYANAYEAYPSVNPATTATVQGIAVNKQVYLKGTVSGNTFTCASSNFLTCTEPSSEDGFFYIPLGIVANDATTKMYFSTSRDLYAYIDGKFRQVTPTEVVAEQQVYIQATAGTTTATPPGEWVEHGGESCRPDKMTDDEQAEWSDWTEPLWTVKRPTFRSGYPVTFVATQRRRMDGTVTCTTPLIDDTTTVIDGGRIITGSVTANQIDATDLHVSAANVDGTLTASQIDTEGLELSVSAITGLGGQLEGLGNQLDSKASAEDVESLSGTVGSMSTTVDAALGEGGTVEKLRSDVDTMQAHISLGTVGEGSSLQPAITLDAQGGSSDGFRNVITNTAMSFMYGNETVAEVNKDELDITRTKVTESMQLGNFMWIPLSDGSLAFKWVEG